MLYLTQDQLLRRDESPYVHLQISLLFQQEYLSYSELRPQQNVFLNLLQIDHLRAFVVGRCVVSK